MYRYEAYKGGNWILRDIYAGPFLQGPHDLGDMSMILLGVRLWSSTQINRRAVPLRSLTWGGFSVSPSLGPPLGQDGLMTWTLVPFYGSCPVSGSSC